MGDKKESPSPEAEAKANNERILMTNQTKVKPFIKKDEPVYVPTFEGFILAATELNGHNSHIFQIHRMMTDPISKSVQLLDLHCIVGGIVTKFKAEGRRYRMTLAVQDD